YRAHDAAISLAPLGTVQHSLGESDPAFCPDGLRLKIAPPVTNDVIIVGKGEPRLYVKDYFLGDAVESAFVMSQRPFLQHSFTVLDDGYTGMALDPLRWNITDPAHAISIAGGKLLLAGGAGGDGSTLLAFAEQLELSGGYVLQHGAFIPSGD